ncbi:MAG: carboxypeptidase regulatory-like domain-containing protein [Bacteroidota bacterium]|nr:carboxypeptidase regulatory-like domain-containing protein [Bacteroidota bacterium]
MKKYFLHNILYASIFLCSSFLVAGGIKGKVKAIGAKNHGNAVIYIDEIEGKTFDPPKEHAKMDQKNLSFIPHILPLLAGTTVDYMNSDDVLHNVFSPDKCVEKFNLGTWPKGKSRSYTFENPGCISVMLCNVHPEMEAYILVLKTPYFVVSEKSGNYIIKNVPPGKYTVKIWHEKLKGSSQEVTVIESGDVTADFEIRK